jgi:cytochrome c
MANVRVKQVPVPKVTLQGIQNSHFCKLITGKFFLEKSMNIKLSTSIAILLFSTTSLADHNPGHVDVKIGQLSARAQFGQKVFNKNCGGCHGINGQGTQKGPPLIHDIYNPGHHPNEAFYRAVEEGVRQHHWPYGNMPPQKQVSFMDMTGILAFIREVQVENGIVKHPHVMQ